MEQGDVLTCRLNRGGKIEVTLDDRVYPDRSCGQYEAGWWVFAPYKEFPNNFIEYFLSESGILYTWTAPRSNYDKACGIHVPWAKRVKAMDRTIEALQAGEPDWTCGYEA